MNNVLKNDYVLWDANHASSNTQNGSINKQMCIYELSRVSQNWPSGGATLQRFVRNYDRELTELSCCTRETCPFQEQGRFEIPRRFEDNHGLRGKVTLTGIK